MAFLGQTYDAAEMPEGTSYEPLPDGWYTARIHTAELKDTADGTGQYIKIRYDIIGPTHQGRTVWGNLNIRNQSAKAEEIGRQQMGELMRAIGLAKVQDTDQFVGGQCGIKLAIRPARTDQVTGKTYDASNDVKGFKSASGASAPAASASAPAAFGGAKSAPAATSAAPAASKPVSSVPWAK